MRTHKLTTTIIIALFTVTAASLVLGQGTGRHLRASPAASPSASVVPQSASRNSVSDPRAGTWWVAQRSIQAAIQQLEQYLQRSPTGERAATARQQLEGLRHLTATAAKPEWVKLSAFTGQINSSLWRVAAVEPQEERTHVTLEIKCQDERSGDCAFHSFERSPLVLIDQRGHYYPMLTSSAPPSGVSRAENWSKEQWVYQAGRTITVAVEFAPLAKGAVAGQVQYRDQNEAAQARFTLRQKGDAF